MSNEIATICLHGVPHHIKVDVEVAVGDAQRGHSNESAPSRKGGWGAVPPKAGQVQRQRSQRSTEDRVTAPRGDASVQVEQGAVSRPGHVVVHHLPKVGLVPVTAVQAA